MSAFKIERQWLKGGATPIDATFARFKMFVGGKVVTAYKGDYDKPDDALEIPLYDLATWIAQNWWPLLWEPRKTDDAGDDPDFLSRHSLLAAQAGFVLPRVTFVSQGDSINVRAQPRDVSTAEIRFTTGGQADVSRNSFESDLRSFVAGVVTRLDAQGISDTDLHAEWSLVEGTDEEEVFYCKLMGALGLSPYARDNRTPELLERASYIYQGQTLLDLCLSSSAENLAAQVELAERAAELVGKAPEASLEPLAKTPVPADNYDAAAYYRGLRAARIVRTALQVKDDDPSGSAIIFDKLNVNITQSIYADETESIQAHRYASMTDQENAPIVGAVDPNMSRPRIALLQKEPAHRRFTAARGMYLAWTAAENQDIRLLTTALTRDQQASRAFAVEVMVPVGFLRKFVRKGRLDTSGIFEAAAILGASPSLVRKQAQNNGIFRSF